MRGWIRGALIAAAGIAACRFTPNQAGLTDAPLAADAGPCQELTATCADDATLRVCSVIDMPPADTACAWGCVGPDAHCGALIPTGTGASATDLTDDAQLLDVVITDDIDGTDGTIKGGGRTAGSGIINGIDYKVVNGYAVFRAKSWQFETHDMNVAGPYPIVLVAINDITIDQLIDIRGTCTMGRSGPGGSPGGTTAGADAAGSGGGKGGGTAVDTNGGGGGAHGGSGGLGGGPLAAAGGTPFGDPSLALLVGGGGGGAGGDGMTGVGGGGGGAIQLVAGGTIKIGTAGDVNASGCGGTHGDNGDSGGGGGAGGAILVEAHDLIVMGSLTVNGGGGGAGGGGMSGSKGSPNRTLAAGGTGGQATGGSGAAAGQPDGSPGATGTHSSGGGGGVGIMRFNTRTGSASVPDPTLLSPNFDDPGTMTSQGSAHVQ
ncbi:MAG: hypothetical protein ABI591_21820 [Kofleriaceae bacterium]